MGRRWRDDEDLAERGSGELTAAKAAMGRRGVLALAGELARRDGGSHQRRTALDCFKSLLQGRHLVTALSIVPNYENLAVEM